jgi:hypothetical protein
VAEILNRTKAGAVFERTDFSGMKSSVLNYFQRWKNHEENSERNVSNYSRKEMTFRLAAILDSV